MLILIDRDELRMVAAASNRKWINLVGYVDYPGKKLLVVDSLEGATWTPLTAEEMATLFKNMSGQEPPEYGQAIAQLRAYADSWPNYAKSETELEVEAERIFAEEQMENGESDPVEVAERHSENIMRSAHQATITTAEQLNALAPGHYTVSGEAAAALTGQAITQVQAEAKQSAPKAPTSPAERPRQGITKKIWEIADELLAVTGSVGNLKEFRKTVIGRAAAAGANEGTAATQFGKWKASKGL
jgi:hypothetical protein